MSAHTVHVACRKWPDSPHWEYDAVPLGSDTHGHWLGIPRGAWLSRPGAGFVAPSDHVTLIPHDAWSLATFYQVGDPDAPVEVYVDIATPATWAADQSSVTAVDLDLDVVRGTTGRIWVDDEDEFAAHRIELGYPDDVVAEALRSCADILRMLNEREAPFDGAAESWLSRLSSLRE